MAEAPQVRFFDDPAGHRVAYASHGSGPPLVFTAWWVSHVENDWEHPGYRAFFETLGRYHQVIRYDRPGAGLSDRDRDVVDHESEVATLGGLIDHLGLERCSILGVACAGPPSLTWATRNPDRIDRLLFFGSYVSGRDVGNSDARDALASLVRSSWGMASTTLADLFAPNLDATERTALGRAQRKSATADMSARLLRLTFDAEVRAQAQHCAAPALVLHRRGDRAIPFSAGRDLAATMPNAVLRSLDGDAHVPWYGDVAAAASAILEFLGSEVENESPAEASSDAGPSLISEGDLVRLDYDGQVVHLPSARGLSDLAILLASPGEEIHSGVLWAGPESSLPTASAEDPMLDKQALASYRQRLADIDEELAEAEAWNQPLRIEALNSERDMITNELRNAVGLGGRPRQLKDISERARKAVSARIRSSIKKISGAHPPLGEHLKSFVSTGTYCSYSPPDGESWTVR